MFKKLFRRFFPKKNGLKRNTDTDSVPEAPRENIAAPIPIPRDQLNASHASTDREGTAGTSSSPLVPSVTNVVPAIQLSVSNSHGFQIGHIQNVTVSDGSVANFNSSGLGLSQLEKSLDSEHVSQFFLNQLDRVEVNYSVSSHHLLLLTSCANKEQVCRSRSMN